MTLCVCGCVPPLEKDEGRRGRMSHSAHCLYILAKLGNISDIVKRLYALR